MLRRTERIFNRSETEKWVNIAKGFSTKTAKTDEKNKRKTETNKKLFGISAESQTWSNSLFLFSPGGSFLIFECVGVCVCESVWQINLSFRCDKRKMWNRWLSWLQQLNVVSVSTSYQVLVFRRKQILIRLSPQFQIGFKAMLLSSVPANYWITDDIYGFWSRHSFRSNLKKMKSFSWQMDHLDLTRTDRQCHEH